MAGLFLYPIKKGSDSPLVISSACSLADFNLVFWYGLGALGPIESDKPIWYNAPCSTSTDPSPTFAVYFVGLDVSMRKSDWAMTGPPSLGGSGSDVLTVSFIFAILRKPPPACGTLVGE